MDTQTAPLEVVRPAGQEGFGEGVVLALVVVRLIEMTREFRAGM